MVLINKALRKIQRVIPRRRTLFLVIVSTYALLTFANGQSTNTKHTLKRSEDLPSPQANINQMNWLSGSWRGDAFGGTFEEVWSKASGGTMLGTFKLLHENEPSMYEFMVIEENGGSLIVKLKHFNPDFSGWEEKDKHVSFQLVKITKDAAYFEGLTYFRDSPDRLKVYVAIKDGEEVHEEELVFYRK